MIKKLAVILIFCIYSSAFASLTQDYKTMEIDELIDKVTIASIDYYANFSLDELESLTQEEYLDYCLHFSAEHTEPSEDKSIVIAGVTFATWKVVTAGAVVAAGVASAGVSWSNSRKIVDIEKSTNEISAKWNKVMRDELKIYSDALTNSGIIDKEERKLEMIKISFSCQKSKVKEIDEYKTKRMSQWF